jgi:Transglycosylase SLT domain
MQLMPGTASQLGVHDAFDPHANVEGGTKYLRELLEKYDFDVPKALAAYNAGSRPVEKYHGVPPYSETQAYVARIIRDFNRRKLAEDPSLAKKMKTTTASSSSRTTRKRRAAQKNPGANTAVKKGPETASR